MGRSSRTGRCGYGRGGPVCITPSPRLGKLPRRGNDGLVVNAPGNTGRKKPRPFPSAAMLSGGILSRDRREEVRRRWRAGLVPYRPDIAPRGVEVEHGDTIAWQDQVPDLRKR